MDCSLSVGTSGSVIVRSPAARPAPALEEPGLKDPGGLPPLKEVAGQTTEDPISTPAVQNTISRITAPAAAEAPARLPTCGTRALRSARATATRRAAPAAAEARGRRSKHGPEPQSYGRHLQPRRSHRPGRSDRHPAAQDVPRQPPSVQDQSRQHTADQMPRQHHTDRVATSGTPRRRTRRIASQSRSCPSSTSQPRIHQGTGPNRRTTDATSTGARQRRAATKAVMLPARPRTSHMPRAAAQHPVARGQPPTSTVEPSPHGRPGRICCPFGEGKRPGLRIPMFRGKRGPKGRHPTQHTEAAPPNINDIKSLPRHEGLHPSGKDDQGQPCYDPMPHNVDGA